MISKEKAESKSQQVKASKEKPEAERKN